MHFLALSIVCSVLVSVLLKVAKHKNIHLGIAICVNYMVCIVMTVLLLKPSVDTTVLGSGLWLFIALGLLLPSVFLIMGKSVQHAGIVKSDTAQRLALIIPIIAAFTLFGETLSSNKVIALILVFIALGCLLFKDKTHTTNDTTTGASAALWLMGVFVGYGVIDVLLKQLSKLGSATSGTLIVSFSIALLVMLAVLLIQKVHWHRTSIIGGIVLGVLNFSNILTYIKAHQAMSDTPTLVFAGMNMGVIILGTLVGLVAFKERVHWINLLGIALGLTAIARLFLF